jgi:hypothetical protein
MGIEYQFILTLQWTIHTQTGSRTDFVTIRGKLRTEQTNRDQILDELMTHAHDQYGSPTDALILFFSLEPNDLANG